MADDEQTQDTSESGDRSANRAKEKADAWEEARETVNKLEEQDEPPTDLKDWPDDEAKYITYGGGEGDHGYEEGPEKKLGPSSLERHEDGSITIAGEKVDNPDDYKADEPVDVAVDVPGRGDDDGSDDSDDDGDGDGDKKDD